MSGREALLALFGSFDSPVLNITAECRCRDFVAVAKARGLPPFAVLLHGLARASLRIENFRLRVLDGAVTEVGQLQVSYTVVDGDGNLNFSTFEHAEDPDVFLARYLADREAARGARELRLTPMAHRDYLYVTCLPWMRFTAIQHPVGRFADCSIPNVAVGRFAFSGDEVSFPISVQAHHGLVDGLHVHRYIACVEELMAEAAERMAGPAGP